MSSEFILFVSSDIGTLLRIDLDLLLCLVQAVDLYLKIEQIIIFILILETFFSSCLESKFCSSDERKIHQLFFGVF